MIVILVHGNWSTSERWTQDGPLFKQDPQAALAAVYRAIEHRTVIWSVKNRWSARERTVNESASRGLCPARGLPTRSCCFARRNGGAGVSAAPRAHATDQSLLSQANNSGATSHCEIARSRQRRLKPAANSAAHIQCVAIDGLQPAAVHPAILLGKSNRSRDGMSSLRPTPLLIRYGHISASADDVDPNQVIHSSVSHNACVRATWRCIAQPTSWHQRPRSGFLPAGVRKSVGALLHSSSCGRLLGRQLK